MAGSSLFQRLSSFLAGVGVTSLIGFYFLYQDVKRCARLFVLFSPNPIERNRIQCIDPVFFRCSNQLSKACIDRSTPLPHNNRSTDLVKASLGDITRRLDALEK